MYYAPHGIPSDDITRMARFEFGLLLAATKAHTVAHNIQFIDNKRNIVNRVTISTHLYLCFVAMWVIVASTEQIYRHATQF